MHFIFRLITISLALNVTYACSLSDDSKPSSVSSANNQVTLGPIAGAAITVKTITGKIVASGKTEEWVAERDSQQQDGKNTLATKAEGRRVGEFSITVTDAVAFDAQELLIVEASGGIDIDPNDDGVIEDTEGLAGPTLNGLLYAVATPIDVLAGRVTVNALTTKAYAAAANSPNESELVSRINRYTQYLLKPSGQGGDLNGDREIDYRDLYSFDPSLLKEDGSRSHDNALRNPANYSTLLPDEDDNTTTLIEALLAGAGETEIRQRLEDEFGDADQDGLANVFESPDANDTDKDNISDAKDDDIDGDEIENDDEYDLGLNPWSTDSDQDGTTDTEEDLDNDGLNNGEELNTHNSDPLNEDTDGDGLTDGQEASNQLDPTNEEDADQDADSDELSNKDEILLHESDPNDDDSDDDGLRDGDEINRFSTNPTAVDSDNNGTNDGEEDKDGDGLGNAAEINTHETDPEDSDSDDDGISDGDEITHELDPNNADDASEDSDEDGLTNLEEINTYSSNPRSTDSDSDTLLDGIEVEQLETDPSKVDSDDNGVNDTEEDKDGDGLTNGAEILTHSTDPTRADHDGDGIKDGAEIEHQLDPLDPSDASADADADGLSNIAEINIHSTDPNDEDSDDDTLSDSDEVNNLGTNPVESDSDGNGVTDDNEDKDGDGLSNGAERATHNTDPVDADTDDDGINDGKEIEHELNPVDVTDAIGDADEDGLSNIDEINVHETDPNQADTDSDGLSDFVEVNQTQTNPNATDSDGNGVNDAAEDSDNDGLTNQAEIDTHNTDPSKPDTDNDGITDGDEIEHELNPNNAEDANLDPDQDGLTNKQEINQHKSDINDADSDDDGLNDGLEVNKLGLDPTKSDTDGNGVPDANEDSDNDGLSNLEEVSTHQTDPSKSDTDDDGINDGKEVDNNLNPNDPADAAADNDSDGLSNKDEINLYQSDITNSDSDGDGLQDGLEANSLETSPTDTDSDDNGTSDDQEDFDSDGLTNIDEVSTHGSDPTLSDTDGDGLSDGDEVNRTNTNPNTQDSDANGTSDAQEDRDNDGLNNISEISTHETDPADSDTDNDALSDGDEVNNFGTSPILADSDGDKLNDGDEIGTHSTDPKSTDSDGDGVTDGDEVLGFTLFDNTTIVKTNPLNPDTDSDLIHDGIEKQVQDTFAAYQKPENAATFLNGPLHPANLDNKPALSGLNFSSTGLDSTVLESDPDGDGKPTIEELFHGSNPNNAASKFSYVSETESERFSALTSAGFGYAPGAWDVNNDGVLEKGFFVSIYEAKATGSHTTVAASTTTLAQIAQVYSTTTQQFSERLCNNNLGGDGTNQDTSDDQGDCRGNQYGHEGLASIAAGTVPTLEFKSSGTPVASLSWFEATASLNESNVPATDGTSNSYLLSLPSESHWMQLIQTAINNGENWTSGSRSTGAIFSGHTDGLPSGSLTITDTSNSYDNTGDTAASGARQKRTLIISNGVMTRDFSLPLNHTIAVWDLGGNVAEYSRGLISAIEPTSTTKVRAGGDRFANGLAELEEYTGNNITGNDGDISSMPNWWKPSINGAIGSKLDGVGLYHDGASVSDTNGDGKSNGGYTDQNFGYGGLGYKDAYVVIVRGSDSNDSSFAGVASANLNHGLGAKFPNIGIRAVHDPNE